MFGVPGGRRQFPMAVYPQHLVSWTIEGESKIVLHHLTGKVVIQLLYLPKTTVANVPVTMILGHRIASLSCSDQMVGQHDVWAGPLYFSGNTA